MSARPICNLPRQALVECRCGRTVCHEGPHECLCGARWGGRLAADTPRTPKVAPEAAQPQHGAPGGEACGYGSCQLPEGACPACQGAI